MGLEAEGKDRLYSLEELRIIAYRYFLISKYTKNKNLLDVGCGTGVGLNYLFDKKTKRITGIDLDIENIKECKNNTQKNHKKIRFIRGDVTHLNLNETFDVICAMQVVQYIGLEKFLKFSLEHIKKKGTIIFEIPNIARKDGFKKSNLGKFYYNSKEISKILKDNGVNFEIYGSFKINSISTKNNFRSLVSKAIAKLPFGITVLHWLRKNILKKQKLVNITTDTIKNLNVTEISKQKIKPYKIDKDNKLLYVVIRVT